MKLTIIKLNDNMAKINKKTSYSAFSLNSPFQKCLNSNLGQFPFSNEQKLKFGYFLTFKEPKSTF